jgi:hypothetical protein
MPEDFCTQTVSWEKVRSSFTFYTDFLQKFNQLTTKGSLEQDPDFACNYIRNQTAVLIIEMGSPVYLRTMQSVRVTLSDQIANLGKVYGSRAFRRKSFG